VHGDDLVEFREGIVFNGNDRAVVAAIVDEDIDLSESCVRFRDYARAIRFERKIGETKVCASAAAGNFFGGRGELGVRARRQEYGSSFGGKQLRHGAANASARAGNQSDLLSK